MKRLFIIILFLSCALTSANAQEAKTVRYSEIKTSYNHKEYTRQATDPYNVGWYECASFFVPGVGQLLAGETWRGLAFIGGEAILMSIINDAASTIDEIAITDERGFLTGYTDTAKGRTNMAVLLGALGINLGVAIWSSIDARRIARVKNMYYQDIIGQHRPVAMGFAPSVSFVHNSSGEPMPAAGVSLRMRF